MANESEVGTGEVQGLLDRARDSLDRSITALEKCSEKVRQKLDANEEYDSTLASHLAWLTRGMADVIGQLRQLEKHNRAQAKTPEQRHKLVRDYISRLDKTRRDELRRLLDQLDGERSILK